MGNIDVMIHRLVRLTQNTPWRALVDMLTEESDIHTIERLSYYILKLLGVDKLETLLEYSDYSASAKVSQRYHVSPFDLYNEPNEKPPLDSRATIASHLVDLVTRLMVQYSYKINNVSDDIHHEFVSTSVVDSFLRSPDVHTRHYIGSPKGGVSLYKCGCCDNIFAVNDSLIPSKEKIEFMNSAYHDANTTALCEFCRDDIVGAMHSNDIATFNYLKSLTKINKIGIKTSHVSIAPPDNMESGITIHPYIPEGGNVDGTNETE